MRRLTKLIKLDKMAGMHAFKQINTQKSDSHYGWLYESKMLRIENKLKSKMAVHSIGKFPKGVLA